MKKWTRRLAAVCVFFVLASSVVSAELKDYVLLVKPMFHQKTRALFLNLAAYFGEKGSPDLKQYFAGMAGEHAFGTGWVIVDTDGQNYILTNRHVVIGAEKVNVYIENAAGEQKAFLDCPILYVDAQMDLAVAQFPGGQKVFRNGFKLDTRLQKNLTEVVAAGFPGFGGEPLWQVSKGDITNSQAHIDPAYAFLIQHSAPIDPGNSGGPLLVKDPTTPLGYSVVGVNTFKALKRESTNFAIPSRHVAEVLEKAKKARKTSVNPTALRGELVRAATVLAGELSSGVVADQDIGRFVSYAMVGESGWQAYQGVLQIADDKQKFVDWFFEDPVEAMRTSISWYFRTEASAAKGPVQFTGIDPADAEAVGSKGEIRTTFTLGGGQKEIAWTWEYGMWRISNMTLDISATPSTEQTPPVAQAPTSEAGEKSGGGESSQVPANSITGVVGIVGSGIFYGLAYTGMLFPVIHAGSTPMKIGLSAVVGGADDGSLFFLGGPAIAFYSDIIFPLRLGIASTPLGTTFVANLELLLKLGVLAFSLDLGYVATGSALFGAGIGVNF